MTGAPARAVSWRGDGPPPAQRPPVTVDAEFRYGPDEDTAGNAPFERSFGTLTQHLVDAPAEQPPGANSASGPRYSSDDGLDGEADRGNGQPARGPRGARGPRVPAPAEPMDDHLPRRRPGQQLAPDVANAPLQQPQGLVDPEEVRARVSALADGLAAAHSQMGYPSTATKDG
jgi:hypothetical protein